MEKSYLEKRKKYLNAQEQIQDFRRKSRQKTEELIAYIHHAYRNDDLEKAKMYVDQILERLDVLDKEYNSDLAILENELINEKKLYLKKKDDFEKEQSDEIH